MLPKDGVSISVRSNVEDSFGIRDPSALILATDVLPFRSILGATTSSKIPSSSVLSLYHLPYAPRQGEATE